MSYYDHATAMAYKLGQWREERTPRNFELEALACEERAAVTATKKQSLCQRGLALLRIGSSAVAPDKPKGKREHPPSEEL